MYGHVVFTCDLLKRPSFAICVFLLLYQKSMDYKYEDSFLSCPFFLCVHACMHVNSMLTYCLLYIHTIFNVR